MRVSSRRSDSTTLMASVRREIDGCKPPLFPPWTSRGRVCVFPLEHQGEGFCKASVGAIPQLRWGQYEAKLPDLNPLVIPLGHQGGGFGTFSDCQPHGRVDRVKSTIEMTADALRPALGDATSTLNC